MVLTLRQARTWGLLQ